MPLSPAGIGVKLNGRSAWLDEPAAQSYKRMVKAGCPSGGITDAGRTNAEQWEMYRRYLAGELEATAAKPGTSKHETGRAVDLADPARAWVRAYGHGFGWIKDRVKNEPWHMEYEAARDTHANEPTDTTTAPITPEDDMKPWFFRDRNGSVVIVTPTGCRWVTPDQLTTYRNLTMVDESGPLWAMDPGPFAALLASLGGIVTAQSAPVGTIDYAALAKALLNDIAARRMGA